MRRPLATCLVLVLVFFAPFGAEAQPQSVALASALRARAVVSAAVDAMGGFTALQNVNDVWRELAGERTDVGQGPRPALPEPRYDAVGTIPFAVNHPHITSVRDYDRGRTFDHLRDTIYGGQPIEWNVVVAPPAGFTAYYDYIDHGIRSAPPAALNAQRAAAVRRWPEGLLRQAMNRADNLRWLGDATFEGRPQQVVAFADGDGTQLSLFFDAATHLLTKVETVGDDPINGDNASETIYLDYRDVSGVKLPSRIIDKTAGFVLMNLRVTSIALNSKPADSLFAKPSGFTELAPNGGPPRVETLGDGVIGIFGADYNSIAVGFNDHILVLEAGANPRYAEVALAQIKQAFPGKPVRYLVSTHWNFDHLGGVRTYVAEGATIVATPLTKGIVERAARATRTLRPDALSRQPREPKFELVTGPKRVFSDGTHIVELYSISPNPHVAEMLVAWLPKEKLLFEADLLDVQVQSKVGTGGQDTAALLAWIESRGFDVQRIIPVHGESATMADLRRSVARRTVK